MSRTNKNRHEMNGLSKSENCPQDASIIEEEDPFAFHSYSSFELEGVSDDKCRNISFSLKTPQFLQFLNTLLSKLNQSMI